MHSTTSFCTFESGVIWFKGKLDIILMICVYGRNECVRAEEGKGKCRELQNFFFCCGLLMGFVDDGKRNYEATPALLL